MADMKVKIKKLVGVRFIDKNDEKVILEWEEREIGGIDELREDEVLGVYEQNEDELDFNQRGLLEEVKARLW